MTNERVEVLPVSEWHCNCCRTTFDYSEAARPICPICKAGDQYTYPGPYVAPPTPTPTVPTAAEINALPDHIRRYVMQLETDADPSGTLRSEVYLREDLVPALVHRLSSQSLPVEVREIMVEARELVACHNTSNWTSELIQRMDALLASPQPPRDEMREAIELWLADYDNDRRNVELEDDHAARFRVALKAEPGGGEK